MSLLGQIIAVEVPVLSVATVTCVGWYAKRLIDRGDADRARVAETLNRHDDALSLLVNQVTPPGAPSLTETLHAIDVQLAVINERQSHGAAENRAGDVSAARGAAEA